MKILITGVHGFIGKKVFDQLKYKDIRGIGRAKSKNVRIKSKKVFNKNITIKNLLKLNFSPDVIIHCAGSSSVGFSIENPYLDYVKNVQTTKIILDFIKKQKKKIRLIFLSSAAVYGNNCSFYSKKLTPISIYGKNKLKSEKILIKNFSRYNYKLIILRVFSVYGIGLRKQLLWDACNKIKRNNNQFYGSGKEIRSWININDLVEYIIYFTFVKNIKYKIIDISGNDTLNNHEFLKKVFKIFNFKKKISFNNIIKIGDPKRQIFNNKKVKSLKLKPKINLNTGLTEYIKWFKKNKI